MLTVLAIRRRAPAWAIFVAAAFAHGACHAQPNNVVAQGPASRAPRYTELNEPPAVAIPAAASTTPALPSWPDEGVESANLQPAEVRDEPTAESPRIFVAPPTATPILDSHVQAAGFTPEPDRRLLGKPRVDSWNSAAEGKPPAEAPSVLPKLGLPLDAIYTTGTALAIVVGLFLLCVWALRRGGRKTTAVLPEEAVSVLGRVPLAARQFAQLVHFGNKLVLLSVTPTGTETLTEITDPAEVDRLLGLCMQRKTHSSTSEFEEVFRKLATEPAEGEFVDRGSMRPTARAATDAYAAYRGGADRG